MSHPALDKFGELLMKSVRDWSISQWDKTILGEMKDSDSKIWHDRITSMTEEDRLLLHELIPEIIDTTMHHFLFFFETQNEGESEMKISIAVDDHKVDDLADFSDGFCGELQTDYGWVRRFSKERPSKAAGIVVQR